MADIVGRGSAPGPRPTRASSARPASTARRARRASETATTRLSRLLTMVPWLVARQGIDVASAARELGVSESQLLDDLNLVIVCGYGSNAGEQIDVIVEDGKVWVSNADAITRPLRLGVAEALTLIVSLRALAAVPGLGERGAIESALAKLEAAAGGAASAAGRVDISIDDDAGSRVLADARSALAAHRRVRIQYLVPSRDESTTRDVDPMRLVNLDGHWYLEGWCHRAEGTRLFRLDRVEQLEVLDADGTPPEGARLRNLDAGTFTPGPGDQLVTLHLDRVATWISDYYPVESVQEGEDGSQVIGLRTADTAWLRRLLLRTGGRARVLEPASLAEEVARYAEAALAAYPAVSGGDPAEPR